jgi:NAD(P)-dependent dehydrogenase (short-subunit alcohol dehydrogenase family)
MRGRFEGKVAIVTGAGRGIGRAIALRIAAEGAHVVVNDIVGERAEAVAGQIMEMGQKALATSADVSKSGEVQRLVGETVEELGTIDILVNNAGVLLPTPLEEITEDEWDWVMDVNVKGVFLCTKAVLPTMKAKGSGKIVNMASSAGRSTSTFGGAHYTTSKAAVLGLTRHTAREMAPFHINVNSVSPGSIDTEMVRENSTPELMASEAAKVPLGRLGAPEDIADLVLFLASDEACYITGATVDINGGDLMI